MSSFFHYLLPLLIAACYVPTTSGWVPHASFKGHTSTKLTALSVVSLESLDSNSGDVRSVESIFSHHDDDHDHDHSKKNGHPYMDPALLPPKRNRRANSTHRLSRLELQKASNDIKRFVETRLESDLHLVKHVAPLAFLRGTGVNDELDGSESKAPVRFVVPNVDIPRGVLLSTESKRRLQDQSHPYEMECEIVQSLAKWKRIMLQRLDMPVGEGIYSESTSIRKGYKGDSTHSVVADQWDFEICIAREQRTVEQLKTFVRTIYKIITDAEDMILERYPTILPDDESHHPTSSWRMPKDIHFVTADELHEEFPNLDVHGREDAAVNKYGAIFILGMGWPLRDGSAAEEVRSPGYDDWNLNGDIIVRHPLTEYRHELSSMGIRVDRDALLKQLTHRGVPEEADLDYQKAVIEERLPFSYGGGIGISRLLMLLLRTGHIGEVQAGLWHDDHYRQAQEAGIDMIPDRIINLDNPKQKMSPKN